MSTFLAGPIKFARITFTGTEGQVVAGVAGKRIRVLSGVISALSTATFSLESNDNGAVILGAVTNVSTVPLVLPFNELGWCETSAGHDLYAAAGVSETVTVTVSYIEV